MRLFGFPLTRALTEWSTAMLNLPAEMYVDEPGLEFTRHVRATAGEQALAARQRRIVKG